MRASEIDGAGRWLERLQGGAMGEKVREGERRVVDAAQM